MAIDNPKKLDDEKYRQGIFDDLIANNDGFSGEKKSVVVRNGAQYTISRSDLIGTTVVIVPTQTKPIKEQVKEETEKKQIDFPFVVEDFLKRYIQAFKSLSEDIKLSINTEKDNGTNLIVEVHVDNKQIGFVLWANNKTRALQNILFIGTGDGTAQSGMDIIFGVSAIALAIEDPEKINDTEHKQSIFNDLVTNNKGFSEEEEAIIVRNGAEYNVSRSEMTGTMVSVKLIQAQ